jgi:class 3 adenylate cyclase
MSDRPETQYVWNDGFAIAYQVLGDGATDFLYLPAFVANVEYQWEVPAYARFLRRLASFSRVITVDLRGEGCSDRLRPGESSTLEQHVGDLLAVMGAVASSSTVLWGAQESAFVAMLAAATHPDLFESLILFSASPAWVRSDDLPMEWSEDRWEAEIAITSRASTTRRQAQQYARGALPSMADDEDFVTRMCTFIALTAPPGAGTGELRRYSRMDLRAIVPSIRTPALILHRPAETVTASESSHWLAEHLPEARFVELPGRDAHAWGEGSDELLDVVEEFVTGERHPQEPVRNLATVLFTDIVDSTSRAAELGDARWSELHSAHLALVRSTLREHRGREVDSAGDGVFAMFDGPARAVSCARSLIERLRELEIEIRAGVHTGEVDTDGSKVVGIAVHIGARICALAGGGEILVSSTVRDLVAGSDLVFADRGVHELTGVPQPWQLYAVER